MRILICDDHALFRDGLRRAVLEFEPESEILETENAEDALAAMRANGEVDLILLDLHLPGLTGENAVRAFRRALPSAPVVVVSAEENSASIRAVLDQGAAGFVTKAAPRAQLLGALRLVLSGGVYVPPAALAVSRSDTTDPIGGARKLSERQNDVLALVARGLTNKEIAGVLGIAETTVKTHVRSILEALEVTNRTEAAVIARDLEQRGETPSSASASKPGIRRSS